MEGHVEKGEEALDLPPGFRFHPTDEEIITCYLTEKVLNSSFSATAIGEADLNKCEPWDLPKRARMGEKEWYFFCQRDRKYPTGTRTNRATESGYWKATGKDREIYRGKGNLVGMKKTLVFYRGRAPKGDKTGWVMHEFRLEGKFATFNLPRPAKDEWVVCKIFHKNTDVKTTHNIPELQRINSLSHHLLDFSPSLPPLTDPSCSGGGADDFSSDGYYIPNNNQTVMMKVEQQQQDYCRNYDMMMMMTMPTNYTNSWDEQNVVGGGVKNETVSSWGMGMDKKCNSSNMEQCSMVSVSQETGLSNDRNAETCSAMSHMMRDNIERNKAAAYEDDAFILPRPPSLPSLPDLDYSLWDDY